MYMKDWCEGLDGFLKMTGKNILKNTGSISHDMAIQKAHNEYQNIKRVKKNALTQAEKDFLNYIDTTVKVLKGGKNEIK